MSYKLYTEPGHELKPGLICLILKKNLLSPVTPHPTKEVPLMIQTSPFLNKYKAAFLLSSVIIFLLFFFFPAARSAEEVGQPEYVGAETCGECHDEAYESYLNNSKKAHSFNTVAKMQRRGKLTPEEFKGCFSCHTTGYGKPGGFISEAKTPRLKNAGCEVCHGPGSIHVESQEAADIEGEPVIERCLGCHNKDRVVAFGFRPLLRSGGH